MELECVKYHEKMDSDEAACRHAGDYCQHRTSCMIVYMEKENKSNSANATSGETATKEEE